MNEFTDFDCLLRNPEIKASAKRTRISGKSVLLVKARFQANDILPFGVGVGVKFTMPIVYKHYPTVLETLQNRSLFITKSLSLCFGYINQIDSPTFAYCPQCYSNEIFLDIGKIEFTLAVSRTVCCESCGFLVPTNSIFYIQGENKEMVHNARLLWKIFSGFRFANEMKKRF